jgi:hypothetical protein
MHVTASYLETVHGDIPQAELLEPRLFLNRLESGLWEKKNTDSMYRVIDMIAYSTVFTATAAATEAAAAAAAAALVHSSSRGIAEKSHCAIA